MHRKFSRWRFDEVAQFIEHSRDGTAAVWSDFEARFNLLTSQLDEDQVGEYVDIMYDDLASVRDTSPQLSRRAHCLILYGAFEQSLRETCQVAKWLGLSSDNPGKCRNMSDFRQFFLPIIGAPAFGIEWWWVDSWRLVRNCIAHNGGYLIRAVNGVNARDIERFVASHHTLIRLDFHNEIHLEDGMLDLAARKTESVLGRLQFMLGGQVLN